MTRMNNLHIEIIKDEAIDRYTLYVNDEAVLECLAEDEISEAVKDYIENLERYSKL